MSKLANFPTLTTSKLNESNSQDVYQFCESNVSHYSFSYEDFEKTTFIDHFFDPDFTIVVSDPNNQVVAFFQVVFRNPMVFRRTRKVAILKFFVVRKDWRRKGLGTHLFELLIEKVNASEFKCFKMKFEVGSSKPAYFLPGLDPRHTEAYFFLEKIGFKMGKERINLEVNIDTIPDDPPEKLISNFEISRADIESKPELSKLKFMPIIYRRSAWPKEILLSFMNTPITTFIAKNRGSGKIEGWASHSIHFLGSFGPTGVSKKVRKKGLGSLLLKWSLWDLKRLGAKQIRILWVELDTVKYYLKSVGAHISETFWTLTMRI